jgi:2-polyprenyl-3-methyl-5-hydroxy-6-metoxy-1,4-benzoquinol methylase
MKVKDHFLTQEWFELVSEPDLRAFRTDPVPKDLAPYYNSEQYRSHLERPTTLVDKIYNLTKTLRLKSRFEEALRSCPNPVALLDVGCGDGAFLAYCNRRLERVVGVETNDKARAIAANKGLTIFDSLDSVQERFDVITLWHVLEHLPNPKEVIVTLSKLLNDNGVILIAVPNVDSWDRHHYKSYWAGFDVPRHLWHFSTHSFQPLIRDTSLLQVATKSQHLDLFYVAYLSERYRSSRFPLLRGIVVSLVGLLSLKAIKRPSALLAVLKSAK